jgi:hypothetical protein
VLLVLDMWYSNYNRQTNLMLNTLGKYHVFLKCPFLLNPMPVNTLPVPLILILICSFFWHETFYKQRGSNCKHGAYRIQLSGAFGYILLWDKHCKEISFVFNFRPVLPTWCNRVSN